MRLALARDTMLGRGVADALSRDPTALVADPVASVMRECDLCILNLECCVSERGAPAPGRMFHFRAPPAAVDALAHLGVDCVTLANNHALDFGPEALLDTFIHLERSGIAYVGAGPNLVAARTPVVLRAGGVRIGALGFADHPIDDAAERERPGIAFADLSRGELPDWLKEAIRTTDADLVLVTPHWGPNMTADPVPHVRAAAHALREAGATLVAGHSAHVFHGVRPSVLFDLGDFLDDYRSDRKLRNDLGLLFLVDLAGTRLEAIPLKLEFAYTRRAEGEDAAWIRRQFTDACAAFGTEVAEEDGRLVTTWR